MTRVLMIGGYLPEDPRTGGGQLIACRLARALARDGHRIEYRALPTPGRSLANPPRSVHFLSGGTFSHLTEPFRNGDHDLVHIHEADE
ncbi:MAG: hypothetical protein LUQ12_03360, partial [Methanoregulaceae archaeon]|nr:hypothetical protein [Methanoregulaceae archaeon]